MKFEEKCYIRCCDIRKGIRMKQNVLEKLKNKIINNQIIRVDYFENCDTDELLDMRDNKEFDCEWMRVYHYLNKIEIKDYEQENINDIREKSFFVTYNLSKSSDIASCISDDFEIICKAYVCEYNDVWLNALIMSYVRGEFPCGELKTLKNDIKDCIDKMFCGSF